MSQPTASQQAFVKQVVDKLGIQGAVDFLGVSYESAKSLYAGMNVRAGTLALLAQKEGQPIPEPKPKKRGGKKAAAPKAKPKAKKKPKTVKPKKKAKAKKK